MVKMGRLQILSGQKYYIAHTIILLNIPRWDVPIERFDAIDIQGGWNPGVRWFVNAFQSASGDLGFGAVGNCVGNFREDPKEGWCFNWGGIG
jgi:hypothetical protein